jgi:hypothetical protein
VRELAAARGPVLSESPELLALAGVRPYLLDPFTLRVLSLRRPELLRQLQQELDARRFSAVVLMYDPESVAGRGWYTNVDFGWPIMSSILANYTFTEVKAGLRVYHPRRDDGRGAGELRLPAEFAIDGGHLARHASLHSPERPRRPQAPIR